jgi:hypothetical protein
VVPTFRKKTRKMGQPFSFSRRESQRPRAGAAWLFAVVLACPISGVGQVELIDESCNGDGDQDIGPERVDHFHDGGTSFL